MSNYDYYIKADLSKYSNEWVAILENKVVAHGSSFKEVATKIDETPNLSKALITRIPAKIAQLL